MGMTLNKCIDFSVDYGFFCTFVNDLYKLLIMKKNLVYVFRCTVMCVVLFLGVLGYVYYEKTLVEWWTPVVFAVFVTVATLPLLGRHWSWLVGEDKTFGFLCHIFVMGCMAYFLFLGGNWFLADESTVHQEEVTVEEKKHNERTTEYRVGRRYYRSGRKSHSYYLKVRLADGSLKEMPVTLKRYNRVRTGSTVTISLQEGALGFMVIKGK